ATQDRIGQWVLANQGTGAWEGYKGPVSGSASLSPQAQAFVNNNPQPGGYGPGIDDPNAPPAMMGGFAPKGPANWFNGTVEDAEAINRITGEKKQRSLGDRLKAAGDFLKENTPAPPRISGRLGDARETGNALLKVMDAPT